jgi:UDP-2-acetamido-3-amino-2,3-dideoxy-glucuronate N-acetyltransferase
MIGAGALVKADVPDYAVMAGVPARRIGWACRCGTTLKFDGDKSLCAYCGSEYRAEDNNLVPIKEVIG